MQKLLHNVAHVVCSLWLGGLVALFIFVLTLFHENHALAVDAAPRLFHVFERYQLLLAAAALFSAIPLKRTGLTLILLLATAGAVVSPLLITPKIVALQEAGRSHTSEFGRLHGQSMLIYTADAVLLLGAGLILANKSSH